jgi:hypothetical protein
VSSSGQVTGPYRIGSARTGMVSGYMTPIPSEWQAALGGPALTGQCCIPIISRTSLGPSATVFDPSSLASQSNAVQLVGYPIDHPTLGTYEGTDLAKPFLMATAMGGLVFPSGTRSVLFFGTQPGSACYGEGTSDPSKVGQPVDGTVWCFDPTSIYKGNHGYPYQGFVWAYDVDDLVAVKQGKKNPWDVTPYATWTLSAPFMAKDSTAILGATYDPATRRIYVSLGDADGRAPVVAVYQLGAGTSTPPVDIPPVVEPPPVTPPVATPPSVQAAAPTATISAATCRLTAIKAKMPSGGGWTAEFFDGTISLGKDAGGPATRPAQTVNGGVHSLTVQWTKAGHDPVTTPPLVLECR